MIVVTDTSVILHLSFLSLDRLLQELFVTVLAPPEVQRGFEQLAAFDSRFHNLFFPRFIQVTAAKTIPAVLVESRIDAGEMAALALALEQGLSTVLMDEKRGRSVARSLGLTVVGLLAILALARQRGLIGPVAPLLDRLQAEARFWLNPKLRAQILQRVGEV